jgi:hypothetical protein
MSTKLPPPLEAYFAAKTHNEIDAMLAPFAESAAVKDEGEERRGLAAIRKWIEDTINKYHYTTEVLGVAESGAQTTVACRLTGDFPGSPVEVRYVFDLHAGKITRLEIT